MRLKVCYCLRYTKKIYGSSFNISGGSVAVPIWVWDELCKKELTSNELIDWCYKTKDQILIHRLGKSNIGI